MLWHVQVILGGGAAASTAAALPLGAKAAGAAGAGGATAAATAAAAAGKAVATVVVPAHLVPGASPANTPTKAATSSFTRAAEIAAMAKAGAKGAPAKPVAAAAPAQAPPAAEPAAAALLAASAPAAHQAAEPKAAPARPASPFDRLAATVKQAGDSLTSATTALTGVVAETRAELGSRVRGAGEDLGDILKASGRCSLRCAGLLRLACTSLRSLVPLQGGRSDHAHHAPCAWHPQQPTGRASSTPYSWQG